MRSSQPEIRNQIRRFRFEHGKSPRINSKHVGVARHTIMALEACKYFPSLLLAFRIARVFGAQIEQVFEYQDSELGISAPLRRRTTRKT